MEQRHEDDSMEAPAESTAEARHVEGRGSTCTRCGTCSTVHATDADEEPNVVRRLVGDDYADAEPRRHHLVVVAHVAHEVVKSLVVKFHYRVMILVAHVA